MRASYYLRLSYMSLRSRPGLVGVPWMEETVKLQNTMRISILLAAGASLALLPGCESVVEGDSCSVQQLSDGGALITCTDGTSAEVRPGADGSRGLQGNPGEQGLPGDSGIDGVPGTDCTLEDNGDGSKTLTCGDESVIIGGGSEIIVQPDAPEEEPVLADELTPEEEAEIDVLRQAIDQGLTLGKTSYIETVSLSLQSAGVADDYESNVDEEFSGVNLEAEACPFVETLQNGFVPTGVACDFLADLAQVEAYAELNKNLDDEPLGQDITETVDPEQAIFWYEQGAISGIEQHRVLVRSDLKTQLICNKTPTPHESSYDKGLVVGMQLLATEFNSWLESQGHTGDYPTMTNPINVCNINQGLLVPAKQSALNNVDSHAESNPLCDNYAPPTQQLALDYAEAEDEFAQGIQDGINAEFALAAVRIFKVIPCNVGDPLVIDLDGDGIEMNPIHKGVNFDFYGTGAKQATAWPTSDDGLLVLDRDGSGAIESGMELFGNVDSDFADGFEQLALLDSNSDGLVTAADARFADIRVWQDSDMNGVSTPAELHSLLELGITAIPTQGAEVSMRSGGTRIPFAAEAITTSGTMLVGDAFFATAPYASNRL